MKLSDKGKLLFELLDSLLRSQNNSSSLTEDELEHFVTPYLQKLSESKNDDMLIIRKLIALNGIIKPEDDCVVNDDEYVSYQKDWYSEVKKNSNAWCSKYISLLHKKRWSPNVIRELDKSTDAIMNLLGNPRSQEFNVRGLIMGDIQSGKTANFIALCNKAADAGYRVIIITAGIIETLRRQTQGRLDEEFVEILSNKQVVKLTGKNYDFKKEQGANPVHVFRDDVPVLCVVKKNVSVLQHLYKWLQKGVKEVTKQGDKSLSWPLLFIDDEADNASINTRELSDELNPTRTNELIRKILKLFKRSSYVGITATPFANVFIDPDTEDNVVADDLFPKSFVYRLTAPSNYFGVKKMLALGSSYLKIIDDIEPWLSSNHKKNEYPTESMPLSLKTTICYYLLVNGVMDILGSDGDLIKHRSMMIHISRFVAIQNRVVLIVEEYIKRIIGRVANYHADIKKAESIPELQFLHSIWDEFSLSKICEGMQWKTFLKDYLYNAISTIEVVPVNSGKTTASLDYNSSGKRYVVVGGNALSRGLTLNGLVVSYFRRNTLMSDTLLQMGRWCGYRDIYQSLVRIWMPASAVDDFGYASDISDEISEMFQQIIEQKCSPKDFAFKLRTSPAAMLPTARNKMRTARCISFPVILAGHAIETPRLLNDVDIANNNFDAVKHFILDNLSCLENIKIHKNIRFLRNVEMKAVVEMLKSFKAGTMSYGFIIPQVAEYIAELGGNWDVVIPSSDICEGENFNGELPFFIKKAERNLLVSNNGCEIMISGTKQKVTSGGVMHYALTPEEVRRVREKVQSNSISDATYLEEAKRLGRNPLLVVQYVTKGERLNVNSGLLVESFFALSLGFPGAKGEQQKCEFYFTKKAYDEYATQNDLDFETED